MTNLSDIIEMLEKAEAGSRDLDIAISKTFPKPAWATDGSWFEKDDFTQYPAYTTSVDAAISLAEKVLPGANRTIRKRYRTTAGKIDGHTYDAHVSGGDICEGKTEALALCRAILKAKAQQQEGGE